MTSMTPPRELEMAIAAERERARPDMCPELVMYLNEDYLIELAKRKLMVDEDVDLTDITERVLDRIELLGVRAFAVDDDTHPPFAIYRQPS